MANVSEPTGLQKDIARLAEQQPALAESYHRALRETLFANRNQVRPAILKRIASAEAESLLGYLKAPTPEAAYQHGVELCQLGLGEQALLRLGQVARQFCLTHLPEHQRLEAIEAVESYYTALMHGFIQTYHAIVLDEQERIRGALQKTVTSYALQMSVAAEIARATTSLLDLNELLSTSVELIRERFDFYYVGLFLVDEYRKWAVLRAGSGEAGKAMLRAGHKLAVADTSMIGWCIVHAEPRIALDVGDEAIRFQNPFLPDTHSEMAIPLISRGTVIGAMTVQSRRVAAFSAQDVEILRIIADQLGNAITNSRLFAEVQAHLEELQLSQRRYLRSAWSEIAPTLPGYVYEHHTDSFTPLDTAAPRLPEPTGSEAPHGPPGDAPMAPASMALTVPIALRDEVIGTLELYDAAGPRAWSADETDLVTEVVNQAALALENARLFEQTQAALFENEKRARYQAGIAQVATILTEYGTSALPDVLRLLAETAEAGQVAYFETAGEGEALAWRLVSEWRAPTLPPRTESEPLRSIPLAAVPSLASQLQTKGVVQGLAHAFPSPERIALGSPATQSFLLLAVPGEGEVPGCLRFDDLALERVWTDEEISTLRTAAVALSNTLARERLFGQVRSALAEAETLYQASAELSVAESYDDILMVLRRHGPLGHAAQFVSLLVFDRVWTEDQMPEWFEPLAFWSQDPTIGSISRFPIADFPSAAKYLRPDAPALIEDVVTNPRLDEKARALFVERFGARSVLFIPLVVGGQWIGLFNAIYQQHAAFRQADIRQLGALAAQAAVAIQNLRSLELARQRADEAQRRNAELALINRVVSAVAASLDLNESLSVIISELARAVGAAGGGIALLNPSHTALTVVAEYSPDEPGTIGRVIPLENYPAARQVIATQEPIVITDAQRDPRIAPMHDLLRERNIRTHVLLPLIVADEVIGTVSLGIAEESVEFTDDHLRLAETVIFQAATAIQTARLFEETRRQSAHLTAAAEISRAASSLLALDDLLNTAITLIQQAFGYYHVQVFLVDDQHRDAVLRASTGEIGALLLARGHKLAIGSQSIIGQVTATGEPVIARDTDQDRVHRRNELLPDTRAELAVPLRYGNRIIGALDVQSIEPNIFKPQDVTVLQILGDQLAIAIENARAFELQKQTNEQLREADRVKTQFLANMSHELRTPLNSIIGFSRVMLKGIDGPLTDLQQKDLTTIHNAGQHLLGLINDILDISKIEAGKMELDFELVDLKQIIDGVMSTTVGLIKDKPIRLHQEIAPNLPKIRADATRVRQVLLNLVSNASKFTEQGEIRCTVVQIGDSVQISVSDTGVGIPPDKIANLFQAFYQVDSSPTRKVGGTGLGLAISRHFIEMHGGEIWAESTGVNGEGTTVTFTLPIAGPPSKEDRQGPTTPLVLVAADEPAMADLYRNYLEPEGFHVQPLHDRAALIEEAIRCRPAAIVLDLAPPDRSKLHVLSELKRHIATRDIPVIVCTMASPNTDIQVDGADEYLLKPVLRNDLLAALSRSTTSHASRR